MPRCTGLGIAWVAAAAIACDDAAGLDARDAGAERTGHYGRDGGSCGDGLVDRGEECDGTVVGQSCESLGLVRGPLSCTAQCTLDTSLCGTDPRQPAGSDGGPFFDGGFFAGQVCEQIVACGAIPLPSAQDEIFLFEPDLTLTDFCEKNIDNGCFECAASEGFVDPDDGGATPCESACRAPCWSLSLPHAEGVFDSDRCVATAADFVSRFDATCLCNACTGALHECLVNPFCHAVLICIDGTGCQGDDCRNTCAVQFSDLEAFTGTGSLDELSACIADNGCREP